MVTLSNRHRTCTRPALRPMGCQQTKVATEPHGSMATQRPNSHQRQVPLCEIFFLIVRNFFFELFGSFTVVRPITV